MSAADQALEREVFSKTHEGVLASIFTIFSNSYSGAKTDEDRNAAVAIFQKQILHAREMLKVASDSLPA